MAFGAAHVAFGNRMMTRQLKLATHVGVAIETNGLDRPGRIDRQPGPVTVPGRAPCGETVRRLYVAAGIGVKTARTVARFASGIDDIGSPGDQVRVIRGR